MGNARKGFNRGLPMSANANRARNSQVRNWLAHFRTLRECFGRPNLQYSVVYISFYPHRVLSTLLTLPRILYSPQNLNPESETKL